MKFKNNPLQRALLYSIGVHVFLWIFFSDFLTSTVTNSVRSDSPVIDAVLRTKQTVQSTSVDVLPKTSSLPPQIVLAGPNQLAEQGRVRTKAGKTTLELAETQLSPMVLDKTEDVTAKGGEILLKPMPVTVVEPVSAEGLKEYRLSLSREARRYKRYPAIARERGLQGVVVIVINTRSGVIEPQVSLSQSSGQDILDEQALEMLRLAVRAAKLPESLRGRDFGLDLPVHFSLED